MGSLSLPRIKQVFPLEAVGEKIGRRNLQEPPRRTQKGPKSFQKAPPSLTLKVPGRIFGALVVTCGALGVTFGAPGYHFGASESICGALGELAYDQIAQKLHFALFFIGKHGF